MTLIECEVGAVADFAEGRPYRVEAGGRGLVLVRRGGVFFALRDICPHQGAPLSAGEVTGAVLPCQPGQEAPYRAGQVLTCPWHGWEYDLATGHALVEPKRFRLRTYKVEVRAGRVWVLL